MAAFSQLVKVSTVSGPFVLTGYQRITLVSVTNSFVSDRQSFLDAGNWIDDVKSERDNQVIIVLVGNKTDLQDKRQVTPQEGEAKAKEVGAIFIETSAKVGYNVKNMFKKVAMELPGLEKSKPWDNEREYYFSTSYLGVSRG